MATFRVPELEVSITSQNETNTPSQFYSAWAAELGLAATGSDNAMTSVADVANWFRWSPQPLAMYSPYYQITTEGGFAMWHFSPPGDFSIFLGFAGIPRAYGASSVGSSYPANSRPALWIITRPAENDCAARNFKNRADALGNAIIFYTLTLWNSSTPLMDIAIRIYGYQKVLMVVKPVNGALGPSFKAIGGMDFTQWFTESLTVDQSRSFLVENTGWATQMAVPVPPRNTLVDAPIQFVNQPPPEEYGQMVLPGKGYRIANLLPPTDYYGTVVYHNVLSKGRRNWWYTGYGLISGDVKKDASPIDVPVRCKVRLLRERDGMQVREVWSSAVDGSYRFDDLEEDHVYTVLAYDTNNNFRAVLANRVVPIHVEPLVR